MKALNTWKRDAGFVDFRFRFPIYDFDVSCRPWITQVPWSRYSGTGVRTLLFLETGEAVCPVRCVFPDLIDFAISLYSLPSASSTGFRVTSFRSIIYCDMTKFLIHDFFLSLYRYLPVHLNCCNHYIVLMTTPVEFYQDPITQLF